MRLRLFRLLFDRDCVAVRVELHHTVSLRVVDRKREHDCPAGVSVGTHLRREQVPVEDVVTEGERHTSVADEALGDDEGLGDAPRNLLDSVGQVDAEVVATPEERAVLIDVLRGGDDLNVIDAGENEIMERVVDRGLVVGIDQPFACADAIVSDALGDRAETRALTGCQNDTLHGSSLCSVVSFE